MHRAVIDPVIYLKKKQIYKMRKEIQESIRVREATGIFYDDLIERQRDLEEIQKEINKYTNTVIQR